MNVALLKTLGTVKQYNQGEFICVEKEEGETAFLLLTGSADVLLRSFGDQPKCVATLKAGTIFGEMSLLENKPRNASVVVSSSTLQALEIKKSNFLRILKFDTSLGYGLLQTLLSRMDKEMDDMYRANIAYVNKIRSDKNYQVIKALNEEQFASILQKDDQQALTLLKYLSHTLAEINIQNSK